MKSAIAEITAAIATIKGCQFASLTYLSKSAGELARYTVNLGFNYHNAVVKSVTELEIMMQTMTPGTLEHEAATAVMASFQKTLAAHERGEQNEDYTKKGQYIAICNGLNVNTTDNTIQLFGLVANKVTITPGVYRHVNSRPLTIAKDKITKQLTVGKFREFALDESQVGSVRVNNETIELVRPA